MMRRSIPALLTLLLLLSMGWSVGCISAEPEIAGTPTPSSSPTPLPDAFAPELTAAPLPVDQLGKTIETPDHYYHYLSLGDIRIYEYDTGTFLDGICLNAYPLPLDGVLNIVYRTEDGKICGIGRIHTADGGTVLATGSNPIYAEINTDIDVTGMEFTLEIEKAFAPVIEMEQAE